MKERVKNLFKKPETFLDWKIGQTRNAPQELVWLFEEANSNSAQKILRVILEEGENNFDYLKKFFERIDSFSNLDMETLDTFLTKIIKRLMEEKDFEKLEALWNIVPKDFRDLFDK